MNIDYTMYVRWRERKSPEAKKEAEGKPHETRKGNVMKNTITMKKSEQYWCHEHGVSSDGRSLLRVRTVNDSSAGAFWDGKCARQGQADRQKANHQSRFAFCLPEVLSFIYEWDDEHNRTGAGMRVEQTNDLQIFENGRVTLTIFRGNYKVSPIFCRRVHKRKPPVRSGLADRL